MISQSTAAPDYDAFLKAKVKLAELQGFPCEAAEINAACEPHQVDTIRWMVQGGRRANFSWFSLGKTIEQLEVARLTVLKAGGGSRALIICPLGVKQEFARDAVQVLRWSAAPRFCRTTDEADSPSVHGVYITNYDSVREGKIDPGDFTVVLLDEAAVLRGFGSSKTFRELMLLCTGDGGPSGRFRKKRVQYRFVSTATPAPNEYIELLAYAEFLGIMDISQAKTRFFKRDSTKADNLTLHPHKEREFWLWLASWALFVTRPSDLGHSDEGYVFPPLDVHWHEVDTDHSTAGFDKSGQGRLFRNAAIGVSEAAGEKRRSLPARVQKLLDLRAARPEDHCVIWHDLEDERHAIQQAMPDSVAVWGTMDLEERERRVIGFSDGQFPVLSTKPRIAGAGTNFQRHCSWAVFFGIGFKFHDFIQAVYRLPRRGQTRPVRVDLIYTAAERDVRRILEQKWQQHNLMVQNMTQIIKQYGLSAAAMAETLGRKMGVERVESIGPEGRYRLVNEDCVKETSRMGEASVHLVVTSIPFATQYEYSPNYSDFGHSENNAAFFRQMDFLTPQLLRVLAPGRVAAVHVKDRIVPGGMNGLGFQTAYPFHADCIRHYIAHGFAYMGMVTVVTDVVRENNQTYRLGWTRQCEDATCMGVGMPEYILLFRKPQSDTSKSYADLPVVKSKADYSRSRWQVNAHAFWRSSGDRSLSSDELRDMPHNQLFRWFREHSLQNVYDLEHHVKLCETLELHGRLPTTFMLLQPASWAPDVWSDVARMRTMNTLAAAKGRAMHLCPLQFDIVDRLIERFSMAGETVYDPFAGVGTVPMRAVAMGRVGVGCELNHDYWLDACMYCRSAVAQARMPSLFDVQDEADLVDEADDPQPVHLDNSEECPVGAAEAATTEDTENTEPTEKGSVA